ncbi:MAG: type VI secretion system tube protein TssD [Limnohabitans sp.]|nr:type VI secretion system tube protein TssD [Limnohabitans sp.]
MSFLAKAVIEGVTMNVLEFDFKINQDIDKSGKPSSDPGGIKIRMLVESTKDTLLFDWMISQMQTKNGTVTFYRRDAVSKMREMQFNEAYCINYREIFLADNKVPMQIEFEISAKEISMNGSKFTRNWPLQF